MSTIIRCGYVDTDSGQLHYREAGDRSLTPLLLLHQSPSSSEMYLALMDKLAGRYWCIAPDNPGFGNSAADFGKPVSEIDVGDYACSIHQCLQGLGIDRCAVFGHHSGAAIAVQLEHDYPGTASAMVLSGPTLFSEAMKAALPAMSAPFPQDESGSHLLGMWERLRGKDPSVELNLSLRELRLAFTAGEHYQQAYAACGAQDFAGQLPAIECPVLVFAGANDPLRDAVAPTLALLQRGSTVDIGPSRTYVCEQDADKVAAVIEEFLANG